MKLSELIKKAQEALEQHGDMGVRLYNEREVDAYSEPTIKLLEVVQNSMDSKVTLLHVYEHPK